MQRFAFNIGVVLIVQVFFLLAFLTVTVSGFWRPEWSKSLFFAYVV